MYKRLCMTEDPSFSDGQCGMTPTDTCHDVELPPPVEEGDTIGLSEDVPKEVGRGTVGSGSGHGATVRNDHVAQTETDQAQKKLRDQFQEEQKKLRDQFQEEKERLERERRDLEKKLRKCELDIAKARKELAKMHDGAKHVEMLEKMLGKSDASVTIFDSKEMESMTILANLRRKMENKNKLWIDLDENMHKCHILDSARGWFEHEVQAKEVEAYSSIDCIARLRATGVWKRKVATEVLKQLRQNPSLTMLLVTNILLLVVCFIMIVLMPSNRIKVATAIAVAICSLLPMAKVQRSSAFAMPDTSEEGASGDIGSIKFDTLEDSMRKAYSLGVVYLMSLMIVPGVLISSGSGAHDLPISQCP